VAGSGSVHCEGWRDRLGWVREGSKLGFAEFEGAYYILLTKAWISEEYVMETPPKPPPPPPRAGRGGGAAAGGVKVVRH